MQFKNEYSVEPLLYDQTNEGWSLVRDSYILRCSNENHKSMRVLYQCITNNNTISWNIV